MKPLKAYKVSCYDEDHGATITFAESARKADRRANSEQCDCNFLERRVRRAAEFDKYAGLPKLLPVHYLAEGWYWGCSGCGTNLYGDHEGLICLDDEYLFCSASCLRRDLAWHHEFKSDNCHESMLRYIAAMERWAAENTVKP